MSTSYASLHGLSKSAFPPTGARGYRLFCHREPLIQQGEDYFQILPSRFAFYIPRGTDRVHIRVDSIKDERTWVGIGIHRMLTKLEKGSWERLEAGNEYWARNGGGAVFSGSYSPNIADTPHWCYGAFIYEPGSSGKGPLAITLSYTFTPDYRPPTGLPRQFSGPDIDTSFLNTPAGDQPGTQPVEAVSTPCNPFVQAFCAAKGMDCRDNVCVPREEAPTAPEWKGPIFDAEALVLTIPELKIIGKETSIIAYCQLRVVQWDGRDIHWVLEDYREM